MRLFDDLASELHVAWAGCGCVDLVFPELARAMPERPVSALDVAPDDLLGWLVQTDQLPRPARDRLLVDLRKKTRCLRQRMLLALVLNLLDRIAIDRALRQIAPGEATEDWLWDSIRSTDETPDGARDRGNLFGFTQDEISEETLKLLIGGHSVEEVSKTIAEDAGLVPDVRVLCATLSALPVLRPLLDKPVIPE